MSKDRGPLGLVAEGRAETPPPSRLGTVDADNPTTVTDVSREGDVKADAVFTGGERAILPHADRQRNLGKRLALSNTGGGHDEVGSIDHNRLLLKDEARLVGRAGRTDEGYGD